MPARALSLALRRSGRGPGPLARRGQNLDPGPWGGLGPQWEWQGTTQQLPGRALPLALALAGASVRRRAPADLETATKRACGFKFPTRAAHAAAAFKFAGRC